MGGADAPLSPESSTIPLSLDLATLHHLEVLEASEDAWSLRSTGSDPYVTLKPLPAATVGGQRVVLSFETFMVLRGWMIWRFSLGHPSRPLSP